VVEEHNQVPQRPVGGGPRGGVSRRELLTGFSAAGAAVCLAGCASTAPVQFRGVDPAFHRKLVEYASHERPGTLVVDPSNHFLYAVMEDGQALRYGVGVGGEGFNWAGVAAVRAKREWPDWYPPKEMLKRKPELIPLLTSMERGQGVPGGPGNPLGARAMYLFQGNRDTLFRIHGTNEPWTIGQSVSAGCIRMTNEDVTNLYDRTPIGTKVIVLRRDTA
jgi:lipoprotein-anchoring transpeptidase ErfK/SrfK